MSLTDLSPFGRAELARLEAEIQELEEDLLRAEGRYANDRPRYEAERGLYPKVRDEEIHAIRGLSYRARLCAEPASPLDS